MLFNYIKHLSCFKFIVIRVNSGSVSTFPKKTTVVSLNLLPQTIRVIERTLNKRQCFVSLLTVLYIYNVLRRINVKSIAECGTRGKHLWFPWINVARCWLLIAIKQQPCHCRKSNINNAEATLIECHQFCFPHI